MTALFSKVLTLGWQAGLLALVVMLIRFFLSERIPKWSLCLLWLLVGLRLLLPFSIRSTASLMNETVGGTAVLESWQESYVGEIHIYHENTPEYREALSAGLYPVKQGDTTYIVTGETATQAPATVRTDIFPILAGMWLFGVGIMLLYFLFSCLRIARQVKYSRWDQWAYYSKNIRSPFVFGLIEPRIFLPENLEPENIPLILAHERAHIARNDHLWKPFAFLLLSVYWFNPILWVAYYLLNRDIESACDERVFRNMSKQERAAYSRALVACATKEKWISACPVAFGENGVADRVKSILNYKKPAFWMILIVLLVTVFLSVGFLTRSTETPVFSLRKFSFEEITRMDRYPLKSNQGGTSHWCDSDNDPHTSIVSAFSDEEMEKLMEMLSGLHFRGDVRNLLPWEVTSWSDRAGSVSASVFLVLEPGTRSCDITLSSSGLVTVYTEENSGTFFYRLAERDAVEPMVEYIKAISEKEEEKPEAQKPADLPSVQEPVETTRPTTVLSEREMLDRVNNKVSDFLFGYFRTEDRPNPDTVTMYTRFEKLRDAGFTEEAYADYLRLGRFAETEEFEAQLLSDPVVIRLWQTANAKGCGVSTASMVFLFKLEEVGDGLWAGEVQTTYGVWKDDIYIHFPYLHRVIVNREGKIVNLEMEGLLPALENALTQFQTDSPAETYEAYFSTVRPLPLDYSDFDGRTYISDPRFKQFADKNFNWNGITAKTVSIVGDDVFVISEDGRYLIQTNKEQSKIKILHEDKYGRMQSRQLVCWENCLFFTASIDSETDALYRLFLPDGTLDVMISGLGRGKDCNGGNVYTFRVISNVEATVDLMYPIWEEYASKKWNKPIFYTPNGYETPAERYANLYDSFESLSTSKMGREMYEAGLYHWQRTELGENNYRAEYYNSLTGERFSTYGYVSANFEHCMIHPDENEHFQSFSWWDELRAYRQDNPGPKEEPKVENGTTSAIYTEEEINAAIEVILEEFATWEGCTMHRITYQSDEMCNSERVKWLNDLAAGIGLERNYTQCIAFLSDFQSPKEGGGAWRADEEYTDWQWWLARTDGGAWELCTWGYG